MRRRVDEDGLFMSVLSWAHKRGPMDVVADYRTVGPSGSLPVGGPGIVVTGRPTRFYSGAEQTPSCRAQVG